MNWPICQIGEFVDSGVAEIQTGPFGTQLSASDYTRDGTPVINVRNIGYANLRNEKLEYVGEDVTERLAAHLLQPNDIVFGRKGAVDRHLFVTSEHENWMQGSDCIRLRFATDVVLPRFASYAFLRNGHQKWMLAQAGNKATMASLNQDIIKRIPLTLPPRTIQIEIVKTLSAYDALIENNLRRIALLEESAQLLYREWFVSLRFPGYEHSHIVDGVPEGWERKTLGECVTLNYGKALKAELRVDGEFPVYGSSGIVGSHNKPLVTGPAIILGRKGNVGSVYWSAKSFFPIDTVYFVDAESSNLHLFYALKHMHFLSTDVAVPGLNRDFAYSRPYLCPSSQVLKSFLEIVNPIHMQLDKLEALNQKLRAARDLLLPRLMSGEINV
mgnify:CR=1 FL=1